MTWRKKNRWKRSLESIWLESGCNPWNNHRQPRLKAVVHALARKTPSFVRRMELLHRAYNKGMP